MLNMLNMLKVSVLFGTFSDVLDKILLSDFVFFDSRIEANWLAFVSPETEIIKEKRKKKIISDRMSAD